MNLCDYFGHLRGLIMMVCANTKSLPSPLLESSLESFSLTKQLCDYRGCGHNTTVCHNGYSNTRFTARHTPNDTTKPFSFISTRVGKISFRATQKGLPKFGTNSKVEELYSNEWLARGKFGKHYSLSKVLSPEL